MAKASPELIIAIRKTALKLEKGAPYQWGHMGSCNCGNLAQEITKMSKADIHAYAMRGRGDWNDQIMDFCPTSGMPMDLLISQMLEAGFSRKDLMSLEKLSDSKILERIPDKMHLYQNRREDVVLYLNTWADLLQDELLSKIDIPSAIIGNAVNQTVTVS